VNAVLAGVLSQCLASPCVVCAYQLTLALYFHLIYLFMSRHEVHSTNTHTAERW